MSKERSPFINKDHLYYPEHILVTGTDIDWTDKCTPIKNQGHCGSCTAFGSIGAIEAKINLRFGRVMDLSERDLFFCSGGLCESGNTVQATLDRAFRVGMCIEQSCQYVDYDCECDVGYKPIFAAILAGWNTITDIKTVLKDGPVIGTMEVHESFFHYLGGVYHNLGPQDPVVGGHCITIVGFNESLKAYIIRNSWGIGWGIGGYALVQYSEIDPLAYNITPCLTPPSPTPPKPTSVTKEYCLFKRIMLAIYKAFTGQGGD
jgi:hypothetical protein